MKLKNKESRGLAAFALWASMSVVFGAASAAAPDDGGTDGYYRLFHLVFLLSSVFAVSSLAMILVRCRLRRQGKPAVEIGMLRRLVMLATGVAAAIVAIYAFGKLNAFASFFSIFGGLLLGLSLSSPLSGLVAWILVCCKRSIRPGDRVQFPGLNLTGDIEDIGAMYVLLNQVGGSIASEEAVGRRVLIPNAMLFNNVVINYTVSQDAAYMLDEVVVRITYDSDWEQAEKILLEAAEHVTADIIKGTGVKPYIRSNLYDYGVYLRLRFMTQVQKRAQIAYKIEKRICAAIQKTPSVDIAIPYVYSYRSAMEEASANAVYDTAQPVMHIPLHKIRSGERKFDIADVRDVAASISARGLLQPIIVQEKNGAYEVIAGHIRLEACRYLGWQRIAAVAALSPESQTAPAESA